MWRNRTVRGGAVRSAGVAMPNVEDVFAFHETTKCHPTTSVGRNLRVDAYIRNERAVREQVANVKTYLGLTDVGLPEPVALTTPLDVIFSERRSVRGFSGELLSLPTLSALLGSLRCTREVASAYHPSIKRTCRPYPSAGGLFPVETYVLALRCEGLNRGVYHYDPHKHATTRVADLGTDAEVSEILGDPGAHLSSTAAACFAMTMIPARSMVKYEQLGYRFALIEAGIVGQQLCLSATALGLGSLYWGSYFDDRLNDLLGADGVDETVANVLWVGRAEDDG